MHNPDIHLQIARERHADFLREARRLELARRASSERPGLLERLRSRFGHRGYEQPAPRAA